MMKLHRQVKEIILMKGYTTLNFIAMDRIGRCKPIIPAQYKDITIIIAAILQVEELLTIDKIKIANH